MNLLKICIPMWATLVVAGCGDAAMEPPAPVEAPRATTITVNPSQLHLKALEATAQLTAEVRDQRNQVMAGVAVTWSSNDAGIARVDAAGLVGAVANGNATITATAGSVVGRAAVVVEQEAVTMRLAPAALEFRALGDTVRLVAEAADANGYAVGVAWSSSDSKVATIDGSGLVVAAGNGTARITATAGTVTEMAAVVVEQEAVELIGLPAVDTILWYNEPGDTVRLVAETVDANGHPVEGLQVEWSSSLAWVATVDGGGLVRGAGEGVTVVTAAVASLRATTELAVVNRDRAALVALYHATDGPNWERNRNWLRAGMRDWEGVVTNVREDGVVTVLGISLGENRLTGPIPPEIGRLTALSWLHLSKNRLTGPIPPEVGNLANLTSLWLHSNRLVGPIPPEIGSLARLRSLELSLNQLTGPIPPELGNLDDLQLLSIIQNALTGPIPPEIGKLANLTSLWLRDNQLTGPIPPALGNLSALEALQISQNALTGPIPPELGNLAALHTLHLYGNALTGRVPPELGDLAALKSLEIYANPTLSGALPQTLTRVPLATFYWDATQLCSPPNEAFQRWLQGIARHRGGPLCP